MAMSSQYTNVLLWTFKLPMMTRGSVPYVGSAVGCAARDQLSSEDDHDDNSDDDDDDDDVQSCITVRSLQSAVDNCCKLHMYCSELVYYINWFKYILLAGIYLVKRLCGMPV